MTVVNMFLGILPPRPSQILHYYLVDDTVEIREIHEPNDGRDPYPVLLCRQRLPKDRYNLPCEGGREGWREGGRDGGREGGREGLS